MTTSLDQTAIEAYSRQGFVSPVNALTADEAKTFLKRFEHYEAEHGGWYPLSKGQKLYLLQTWVAELAQHQRVLDAVEGVLGPDILCWGCSLFVKDPGNSQFVSWHQDSTYWGLSSPDVVTAWIALTPATHESGCMKMWPGSHLRQQMPHHDTLDEKNLLTRGQEISVKVDEAEACWLPLEPGQLSLHNIRTVHASEPNQSSHRRIGVALRFIAPHVKQINAPKDSAWLVRGEDRFGHFVHEQPPGADMDEAAVAEHARIMEMRQSVLYDGVAGKPAHTEI
jgi:non-heme Fe2+,alpha-ketoglutarate-dependent halogenase